MYIESHTYYIRYYKNNTRQVDGALISEVKKG